MADEFQWFTILSEGDFVSMEQMIDEHACDIYRGFPYGDSVMFCAFNGLTIQLTRLLDYFKQNSDLAYGKVGDVTALMLAAMRGQLKCLELLLHQAGIQTAKGVTALMLTAVYDRVDCAECLAPLECGYHTGAEFLDGPIGETALSLAVRFGSKRVFEVLLPLEFIESDHDTLLPQMEDNKWITEASLGNQMQITLSLDSIARSNAILVQMLSRTRTQPSPLAMKGSSVVRNVANSYQTPNNPGSGLEQTSTKPQIEVDDLLSKSAVEAVHFSATGWPCNPHQKKHKKGVTISTEQAQLCESKTEEVVPVVEKTQSIEQEASVQAQPKPTQLIQIQPKIDDRKALAAFVRKNKTKGKGKGRKK